MARSQVDDRRARPLNGHDPRPSGEFVIYWMSRDQRVADNWALLYAQEQAHERGVPLLVVFSLTRDFLGAPARHYDFMLRGLTEVEQDLHVHNIGFRILTGAPAATLPALAADSSAALVVTDFSPLRVGRDWRTEVADALTCPLIEVDAHNIVPAWLASDKQEYAARTFRPKIHRLLPDYLIPFPDLKRHTPGDWPAPRTDWSDLRDWLKADSSVAPVSTFTPGAAVARETLDRFLAQRLAGYPDDRNDPTLDGQSGLSPYLHYGQLSAQRAALEAQCLRNSTPEGVETFIEELVVRRELSDNYCLYQPAYDTLAGAPDWARATLDDHRADERPHLYTLDQFEAGETADPAWNAAQHEMVHTGKMHNLMRMYWAKKILEWSESPEQAYAWAIYLNDRYELDGRDPNGYTGVAWSIGGVHDRAWAERPIFGTVRWMSQSGLKRKFDLDAYIAAHASP